MKRKHGNLLVPLLALMALSSLQAHLHAQGSLFTYQGRLGDNGNPANGSYDFRFRLASDALGNNFVAGPLLFIAVPVSAGLFTCNLDFGAGPFNGSDYWLQIDVKTNGAGSYATLNPLQPLTPAPYAIMANVASNLLGTLPAGQLTGTVGTSQLADGSITSAKIADLTIGVADLAADAVTSAKILDGTLQGGDLGANTVGSDQLANTIELGHPANADGRLDIYRTPSSGPVMSLVGAENRISLYGDDSLEQVRLSGPAWGEILLFDNTPANNQAVLLTANDQGGGRLLLQGTNGNSNVDLRAEFVQGNGAAWGGFKDNGSERVTLAARNGTSGVGGLIEVKNNSTQNTLQLIGDEGAGRAAVKMYNGATLVGQMQGQTGGGRYETFDEAGIQTVIIGSSAATGGFCELNNSAGVVGLRLDGDDGGGGLVALRSANNAVTVAIDGDEGGGGSVALRNANNVVTVTVDGDDGGGSFVALRSANNTVAVALDGDDGGAGLVALRNATNAITVTIDGDVSGRSRITAHEFQIASTTVTLTNNATLDPATRYARISGSGGDVTLNAANAIADGAAGVTLVLEGTSDAATVTIPDNANTRLGGNRSLGVNDTLSLIWNGSDWVELSFANN